jgi:hypothetical protein
MTFPGKSHPASGLKHSFAAPVTLVDMLQGSISGIESGNQQTVPAWAIHYAFKDPAKRLLTHKYITQLSLSSYKSNLINVKVRGVFRLRNLTVVGFYYLFLLNCYMFRSYDHLHVEIYLLGNYSTDNGLLSCYMFRSYDHLHVEIYLFEN